MSAGHRAEVNRQCSAAAGCQQAAYRAVFPDGGHSPVVSSPPVKQGASFFAGAMHSRDEDTGKVTSLVAPG